MKNLLTQLSAFLLLTVLSAQPTIEWQKCYGGSAEDKATSIQQTPDGGYILSGFVESNNGDVSGNHGDYDAWVLKITNSGIIEWQRTYGGIALESGNTLDQCDDGGYILASDAYSNNADVTGNHGGGDSWVVKINNFGTLLWQKSLGGSLLESPTSILQTDDGGFVLLSISRSSDGDVTGNHGQDDIWIAKLSNAGEIQWQKSLGGSEIDQGVSIQQTSDDGYIVAGRTNSNDNDVSGNHGNHDCWVLKLSHLGEIEWQKCFGGSLGESTYSIIQTRDNGFVLAGNSNSHDGDVTGNPILTDFWIVRLSEVGEIQWQKTFGGSKSDFSSGIQETKDGGYVVCGSTISNNGDVSGNHGDKDYWILKLDSLGTLKWQKTLGGTNEDYSTSIIQTSDEGYIIAGYTSSNDGDVSGNHGAKDWWVVKLSSDPAVGTKNLFTKTGDLEIFPNPASTSINLKIQLEYSTFNIVISDLLGRKIRSETMLNAENVDVSQLPNGYYFIQAATADGQVFSGRFSMCR